ncbi:MAG: hypothetical protein ACM3KT_05285, partial [Deltaproteobacteria bacterium]
MTKANWVIVTAVAMLLPLGLASANEEQPVMRSYTTAPPAPAFQTLEEADAKSGGCVSCHTKSDRKTMHPTGGVVLGCTDCHGGDASVSTP